MTPEINPNDSTVADSINEEVHRRWGSAVEDGAPISASIKSSAFDAANAPSRSGRTTAPFRNIVTGGGEAVPPDSGDFVLGKLLGQGGMGLVYRAGQTGLDRDIALKTIMPDRAATPEARAKFVSEARVTGQLDHPNIVPIYELASAPDGGLFYTMLYHERGDRSSVVESHIGFFQRICG